MKARVVFCLILALALVASDSVDAHRGFIEGSVYIPFPYFATCVGSSKGSSRTLESCTYLGGQSR